VEIRKIRERMKRNERNGKAERRERKKNVQNGRTRVLEEEIGKEGNRRVNEGN
jgi:hypothetical protein